MREGYDVGQVCLNGHPINGSSVSMPQFNQDYCDKCGEKTIIACPNCETSIRGYYFSPGVLSVARYQPPAHCYKCGKPFTWTERKIKTAVALAVEEGRLNDHEARQLEESVKDILTDTPQTQLGASRFKRVMTKVGQQTAMAVRDILVDVVSETAKKAIWGK